MKRIDVSPELLKRVFVAVARGSTLKGAVATHCPGHNLRTIQKKISGSYKEDYATALFKRSERNRKIRCDLKRAADRRYSTSDRGKMMRRTRVHGYRQSERYRKWEKWCCKSYRAGKLLGIPGAEVRKMWLPHLLSYRWFGIDYSVNEMTPEEIKRSEATELPFLQRTPLPHTRAHSLCDA